MRGKPRGIEPEVNKNVPNVKTAYFTRVVLNFPFWSFEFVSNF